MEREVKIHKILLSYNWMLHFEPFGGSVYEMKCSIDNRQVLDKYKKVLIDLTLSR